MDAITGQIGRRRAFSQCPAEMGRGLDRALDRDIGGDRRCAGNLRHDSDIERRQLGRIVEINPLDRIAINPAILGAQILVLAVIMLIGFHDAHAGNANGIEGAVMAAAAKAVEAVDHHDIEIGDVLIGGAVNHARQIARRAVDLAAGKTSGPRLFRRFDIARAFGEDAGGGIIGDAVDAGDIADHVVIEHGLDAPAFGERMGGEDLAAKQALLLARQAGIDDRAVKLVLAEHARRFQNAGHAGGIVIGAGTVGCAVERIGDAAVDIAGHQHIAVRIDAATLDGDDTHDIGRLGNAGLAGNRVRDIHHLQAAATIGGDALEFVMDPAPGGTDAARITLGLRQGMTRAETGQGPDIRLDAVGRDGSDIVVHGENFGRRCVLRALRLGLGSTAHQYQRGGQERVSMHGFPNSS